MDFALVKASLSKMCACPTQPLLTAAVARATTKISHYLST